MKVKPAEVRPVEMSQPVGMQQVGTSLEVPSMQAASLMSTQASMPVLQLMRARLTTPASIQVCQSMLVTTVAKMLATTLEALPTADFPMLAWPMPERWFATSLAGVGPRRVHSEASRAGW